MKNNEEALIVILDAIKQAGFEPGVDVMLAMDPAASEFYKDGKYVLAGEGRELSSEEMVDYWENLVNKYPIISLEDGMAEEDWDWLETFD